MDQETYIPGIYKAENGNEQHFKDNAVLYFGDADDISIKWDGTNLVILPVADDTGAINIGNGTLSIDVKLFGSAAGNYLYFDISADLLYTTGVDIQLKDLDMLVFGTGAGGSGDINITWNGSALVWTSVAASSPVTLGAAGNVFNVTQHGTLTVGVNDTGYDVQFFGATTGKYLLWDESADALIISGILQLGTVVTAALAIGGGTSATKLTTSTADKNFLGFWTESTATSGDSRGMYLRHYLGGTIADTGFGDAFRAFCTVTGTGYSYASGIHATLQVNAGATVTGSGAAGRFTLAAATDTRTLDGQMAALQLDSDVAAGNTLTNNHALIRLTKSGSVDVTTFLDIADDQCLKGSSATGAPADALKVIMPNGDVKYISLIAAA